MIKGEKIPAGLYHLASEIIVRHADGDFLVTQRAFEKRVEAGKREVSAGGAVLKGETPAMGAERELFEETGIRNGKFRFVYYEISETFQSIFNVYFCVVDCDKNAVRLQKEETISYSWVPLEELLDGLYAEDTEICRPESIKKALKVLNLNNR